MVNPRLHDCKYDDSIIRFLRVLSGSFWISFINSSGLILPLIILLISSSLNPNNFKLLIYSSTSISISTFFPDWSVVVTTTLPSFTLKLLLELEFFWVSISIDISLELFCWLAVPPLLFTPFWDKLLVFILFELLVLLELWDTSMVLLLSLDVPFILSEFKFTPLFCVVESFFEFIAEGLELFILEVALVPGFDEFILILLLFWELLPTLELLNVEFFVELFILLLSTFTFERLLIWLLVILLLEVVLFGFILTLLFLFSTLDDKSNVSTLFPLLPPKFLAVLASKLELIELWLLDKLAVLLLFASSSNLSNFKLP